MSPANIIFREIQSVDTLLETSPGWLLGSSEFIAELAEVRDAQLEDALNWSSKQNLLPEFGRYSFPEPPSQCGLSPFLPYGLFRREAQTPD
jgi:hypothetical protein